MKKIKKNMCVQIERNNKLKNDEERGSLSLEHVLFIGAVVALTAGVGAFYSNMSDYFSNIGFSNPPANFGSSGTTTSE